MRLEWRCNTLTAAERSARKKGTSGTMLPTTQVAKVAHGEIPIQLPTGIPPRSSTAGSAEMSISTAQLGRPVCWKKRAIF